MIYDIYIIISLRIYTYVCIHVFQFYSIKIVNEDHPWNTVVRIVLGKFFAFERFSRHVLWRNLVNRVCWRLAGSSHCYCFISSYIFNGAGIFWSGWYTQQKWCLCITFVLPCNRGCNSQVVLMSTGFTCISLHVKGWLLACHHHVHRIDI